MSVAQSSVIPDTVFKNLRRFNLIMGFFHLIQGVAMILVSNDFSITLTTLYLKAVVGEGTFSLEQNLPKKRRKAPSFSYGDIRRSILLSASKCLT